MAEYRPPEGETFGLFVFAGYAPETELVRGLAECSEQGYVVTDQNQKTTCEGLYAAGDVCIKPLRQVVTAVGDGALAATELERYAAAMQKKTGLHPEPPSAAPRENSPEAGTGQEAGTGKTGGGLFTPDMLAQLETVFGRMASPLVLKLYLDGTPLSAELEGYMGELASLTGKLSVEKGTEALGDLPCVRVCRADGSWTGLAFHGVPGGHEFTSFVLGLYNAAGPGQALEEEKLRAAREKYQVMSVPCLVVGDGEAVSFGKKNISQLLELLKGLG